MAHDTMNWWRFILLSVALVGIGYLFGRTTRRTAPESQIIVKVDTLLIRDTITRIKPIERISYETDTILRVVHHRDTIYLPREVKVYEDSTYRAVVSGVSPSLDTISVFNTERIIYKDRVEYIPKTKRWGVGLQVGYGMGVNGTKVITSPYIGIGIQYNIIAW